MAQTSGFFNALLVNGDYDRKYNAEHYSDNIGAIITSGVLRSGADDLKVKASGLTVTVGIGRAWVNGHWYKNDTALTLITVTAPTGSLRRKDSVFLRCNTSQNVRSVYLHYEEGTPASTPKAPAPTRSGDIYDLKLAEITVAAGATSLTVTDTRANKTVCGWVTSPVGYDDYFTSLDNEFNAWFDDKKATLSSVTLFKLYLWRTVTTATVNKVSFNIPQYDSTGTDIVEVYVNGLLEVENVDYTLNGSTITFITEGGGNGSKVAGTEIVVKCYKSIDGAGLGSVSDEITALQNSVATLAAINDYYYICNGSTDNVAISSLVQAFLNGSTNDNAKLKINVIGTFGATAAAAGSGSTTTPYRWFNFVPTASTNRRVTLDFTNCMPVSIQPKSGTFNNIVHGDGVTIDGLTLTAGTTSYSSLQLVGSFGNNDFINCNFTLNAAYADGLSYFAESGNIENCKIIVINTLNNAAVINSNDNSSFARVKGGFLYAYTGLSTAFATAVYAATGLTSNVVTLIDVCAPSTAKSGLYQTNAIRFNAGFISSFALTSPLPVTTTSNTTAAIIGTIALDKD